MMDIEINGSGLLLLRRRKMNREEEIENRGRERKHVKDRSKSNISQHNRTFGF